MYYVYLGNGDGTFKTGVTYPGMSGTSVFILADIEDTGHPDVVSEYYPGLIAVAKNNADGTFGAFTQVDAVSSADILIGVNHVGAGGASDLLFASPAGTAVQLAIGPLTYGPKIYSVSGRMPQVFLGIATPVAGDFNNDGNLDLATPVEGGIALLFGKGDGTFASADVYDVGQITGAAAVADFNGDGAPDIAVTLPATFPRLLFGNGQGTFTLAPDQNAGYGTSSPASNIVAADFSGDGKPDVDFGPQSLTSLSNLSQTIAFNAGGGSLTTPGQVTDASPITADFNGDGRADMLYVAGITATTLLGQANETFSSVTTILRTPPMGFGVGDVNKDGKPDLVLNFSDHVEIWLGNGDGSFTYSGQLSNDGYGYYSVAAVKDVDGDGNADILLLPYSTAVGTSNALEVFYGNGDGSFQPAAAIPTTRRYTQVVVSDLNLDSQPDLVMTDGNIIAVLTNQGSRQFSAETYFVAGQTISWLNLADVNGDGFPDIVVANPGGTTVTVLLNQANSFSGSQVNGTLALSPEPPIAGSPITISLTLTGTNSGPTPTGSVSFSIDGAFAATASLANGTASYAIPNSLTAIQHTFVAVYSGDGTYRPRSFPLVELVQAPTLSTQTTLTATPTSLLTSQTVRLVADVTSSQPISEGSGFVTFYDGGNVLGSDQMNPNGSAYFDTALLSAGSHLITATFQGSVMLIPGAGGDYGSAVFSPSTSPAVTVVVTSSVTTSTLSSSSSSLVAGTVVTLTAAIASTAGTPFGGVTFYDGSEVLGTMGLNADGNAAFSSASLTAGSHSITAAFNANGPFAASVSAPVLVSVQAAPASIRRTMISLAPVTATASTSPALVAQVTAADGSPSGVVTFLDNGAILGSANTDSTGAATLSLSSLGGSHVLTASFLGSDGFAPSVSPTLQEQWPPAGPQFAVVVADERSREDGASLLLVRVIPSSGFSQTVRLSCGDGVPAGYQCQFSPSALNGGGVSNLLIQPVAQASTSGALIAGCWLAFGVLVLSSFADPRHRLRTAMAGLLLCASAFQVGCAGPTFSEHASQEIVLTIRVTSGTGSGAIVHSTQATVRIP